ncbi:MULTISPECIES: hypothetical protein [unclassified Pseudoclavibacter]|uniref:hypothetical protein n=1 Tax=unclassified Pseudoclavibacter TaxID=2615177 RepID=UPI000CE7A85F|nr:MULTISPECIES: hypothetical protein [unclassified Pseudoclavibacter]MBS3177612.1 hypothetical protein [Pseudoclavibacter sp. Marseille-Q4354]NYF13348.1 hypothetical protein [Pseudoclavibacter sp. JAI123]PPG29613.1 hypothetical protein C5B97_11615 [Pseudoclavibacter sp. RFBB5]
MTPDPEEDAWRLLSARVDEAISELRERDARRETLAELVERRPVLGVRRGPVLRRVSNVWRLRELLLDESGGLFRVGSVIRVAKQPDHYSEQSALAAERRRVQLAALKSGFALGEVVNYGAARIQLSDSGGADAHPGLEVVGGEVVLHWGAVPGAQAGLGASSSTPLAAYLDDAVALLTGR